MQTSIEKLYNNANEGMMWTSRISGISPPVGWSLTPVSTRIVPCTVERSLACPDVHWPQLPFTFRQEDLHRAVEQVDSHFPPLFQRPSRHNPIVVPSLLIGQHLYAFCKKQTQISQ